MGIKSTTIQKQYAYTGKNIGKLSSSMLHSIRHSSVHLKMDDDGREIKMWDESKSGLNYIIVGGSLVALDSFSDEQKEKMVFNITKEALSDLAGENRDVVLENEIKDLTKKVNKKASNLKKNKGLFTEFSELKGEYITNASLDIYKDKIRNDGSIKRVEQKLKPLENFQKQNNELVELQQRQKHFKLNPNQGLMQESFLKFPRLKNGTITPEKHTQILQGFYQKFYPGHDIKGAFWHGDEESLNESLNESSNDGLVDCGGHPHVILSCKDKDGRYTLIKKQKQMSIDYIKNNPDKFPQVEPDKLKTSYRFHKSPRDKDGNIIAPLDSVKKSENREMSRYLRALGIAQQEIMLDYAQEQLKPFGIELYRNEYKSKADKKRLLQLENDKNLPKHLRVGNSHNAELDKENKILKQQNKQLKQENFKYDILKKEKEKGLIDIDQRIEHRYKASMYAFTKNADLYIDNNKGDLTKMIDYVSNHDNKEFLEKKMKQDNLWLPVINKIEESISDENSALRKIHKAALFIPGYKKLFNEIKPIYFEQYKAIKGERNRLDTKVEENKGNVVDDKLNKIEFDRVDLFAGSGGDDEESESISGDDDWDKFVKITKANERDKKKKNNKNKMGLKR